MVWTKAPTACNITRWRNTSTTAATWARWAASATRPIILSQIVVGVGDHGVDYNFCEASRRSISGYVFQDGPPIVLLPGQTLPDIETIRDGVRNAGDKPIAGVTLLLYDGQGNPVLDGQGHQLTAVTDANGFYEFTGLDAGTYVVRELQPGGYIDAIDTPGSTGGVAQNHHTPAG